jgi:hypothetical protein
MTAPDQMQKLACARLEQIDSTFVRKTESCPDFQWRIISTAAFWAQKAEAIAGRRSNSTGASCCEAQGQRNEPTASQELS